jgi:uncharacterized protein YciI
VNVPQEEEKPEMLYAVRLLPGPKWVAGKSAFEQPGIQDHIAYMEKLQAEGRMRFGGPFLDGMGGQCAITAESTDDAKAVASADPAVAAGLLVPEVHPWLLVMPATVRTK